MRRDRPPPRQACLNVWRAPHSFRFTCWNERWTPRATHHTRIAREWVMTGAAAGEPARLPPRTSTAGRPPCTTSLQVLLQERALSSPCNLLGTRHPQEAECSRTWRSSPSQKGRESAPAAAPLRQPHTCAAVAGPQLGFHAFQCLKQAWSRTAIKGRSGRAGRVQDHAAAASFPPPLWEGLLRRKSGVGSRHKRAAHKQQQSMHAAWAAKRTLGGCVTVHMGTRWFGLSSMSSGCTSTGTLHGLQRFPPLMLSAWRHK